MFSEAIASMNPSGAITTVLPEADRYVETTSEFDRVKSLLAKVQNERPSEDKDRPTLRRRTRQQDPDEDSNPPSDDDDRPTLKRHP